MARTREHGSALVLALLVMVIMTLLGLAFAVMGQMEGSIALNKRDADQALFVAEGGVRIAKKWFDAPSGTFSYLVPTVSQMDRSLRWVDDNGDGTYGPYSSATAPFNVAYRNTTNDPFEKPYRGSPAFTILGTEDHPDVRISESGSSAEQAFLASVNATLYPGFPSITQRARIVQLDVYAPPITVVSGNRVRFGVATIKVTAGIYEHAGGGAERRIATKVVKAVINELPIPGPGGPLQSNVAIDFNGEFAGHWGKVTATANIELPSNLDVKIPSGVPWYDRSRIIARDMNLDGTLQTSTTVATPDDQNFDGTLDFDTWIASSNVEDPWLRFWAESNVTSGGKAVSPDCSTSDCQPSPWYQGGAFGTGTTDHSNIFKNVSDVTFPSFDYALWKNIAQSGGAKIFYYASNGAGTGTYRLNGTGPSVSFETATDGKEGIFFFDTATNSAPVDADANGTYENLSDAVQINGGAYTCAGFVFLNADFQTTGAGGSPPSRTVYAPGEPYIDANGNKSYDPTEYFLDLDYPNSINNPYVKNGMRREADGYTRQIPWKDASSDGVYSLGVNFYGVFYTSGNFDATGNWIYYGSMLTKQGMTRNGGAGTPDIYYDERLTEGRWPPPDMGLPRTVITAWETDQ